MSQIEEQQDKWIIKICSECKNEQMRLGKPGSLKPGSVINQTCGQPLGLDKSNDTMFCENTKLTVTRIEKVSDMFGKNVSLCKPKTKNH